MNDIVRIKQKNDRIFVLVCLNFLMLFILFCGMGFVIWQSSKLVQNVDIKLQKVEQVVDAMRTRIHELDTGDVMAKVMDQAVENVGQTVSASLQDNTLMAPLRNVSDRIQTTQEKLEKASETIRTASERLQNLDTDEIAQQVSYQILKGLGEGFDQAAEKRKP